MCISNFACSFYGKDKCASGLENIGRRGSGAFPEGALPKAACGAGGE